jgi:hypothetical protein
MMHGPWYNVSVVMLWLVSMGWLVTQKVLPPLLVGEPPNYRTILAARRSESAVGWKLLSNGRPLGCAVSTIRVLPSQCTEIRSQVQFDLEKVFLQELAESWLRVFGQFIERPLNGLHMTAESIVTIDSLARLLSFDSSVRQGPRDRVVRIQGMVEGGQINVSVRAGDLQYNTDMALPANALVADTFSPQTQLPGLRAGQTWTVPSYNPLSPRDSVEILQATVEGSEPIVWNKRAENTWVVVYRDDAGSGLNSDRPPRGRLWVRRDGTVLRQQITILGFSMVFVRLPDDEAAELALSGGWAPLDGKEGAVSVGRADGHDARRGRRHPPDRK